MDSNYQDINNKVNTNDIENNKIYDKLEKQVEEIKNVIINNIDLAIDRDNNINELVNQSDELTSSSFKFNSESKKLKYRLCRRNIIIIISLIILAFIVIFIIIVISCGGFNFDKCK